MIRKREDQLMSSLASGDNTLKLLILVVFGIFVLLGLLFLTLYGTFQQPTYVVSQSYLQELRIEMGGEKCRDTEEDLNLLNDKKTFLGTPERHVLDNHDPPTVRKKVRVVQILEKRQRCDNVGRFWQNNETHYRLLKSDKPISIMSFGFYGPVEQSNATFIADIEIWNGTLVASRRSRMKFSKQRDIFHVSLRSPAHLMAKEVYILMFSLKGPGTYCSNFPSHHRISQNRGAHLYVKELNEKTPCLQLAQIGLIDGDIPKPTKSPPPAYFVL